MSYLNLEGRVVIVTGGALGIGRSCSEALAEQGAKVVVADFNDAVGKKAEEEIRAKGHEALFVKVDVSSPASVKAMVAEVLAKWGDIDAIVNNAGINIPRLLVDPAGVEEMDEASFDRTFSVNVKGMFLCAQAVARHLIAKKKKGVILNMASESGQEGSEGQSAYAASKASAFALTRSWAKELGKQGVRVVGLAPGILEATALRSEAYEKSLAYSRGITVEQLRAGYEKVSIPIGRPGKLSEVADAVCWLVSDRSSYCHGTTVNLSGGKSRG